MPERYMSEERYHLNSIHEEEFWGERKPFRNILEMETTLLKKRLVVAGFDEDEVNKSFTQPIFMLPDRNLSESVSDGALKFLADTSHELTTREPIYVFMRTHDGQEVKSTVSRHLEELAKKSLEDESLRVGFSGLMQQFVGKEERESVYDFGMKLTLGSRILLRPSFYALFQNNPEELAKYLEHMRGRYSLREVGSVLDTMVANQHVDVLLEGLRPDILMELYYHNISPLASSPEMARVVNGFMRLGENKSWSARIRFIKPALDAAGIPYRIGPETDEELLEDIEVHENPNHPAISMGLLPTLGWEIEYDYDTDVVRIFREKRLAAVLQFFGFKAGTGGGGTDEASPGPCYYPKTLLAIYQMYADARIIDARTFKGSTCHFNENGIPKEDMVKIVRASYLTGASMHAYNDLTWDSLPLFDNNGHVEGKVFAIMDDEDFKWNFNAVSRLVAARKALNYRGKGYPGEEWRERLAAAWEEWDARMATGMSYLGRGQYLDKSYSGSVGRGQYETDTQWNRAQLQRVYNDPSYTILPDLEKVGQMDPNTPNASGIQGVMVKGEDGELTWYPNIAIFARKEMDRAVVKIEEVFADIDRSCVADIRKIESEKDQSAREKMITEFSKKYAVIVSNPHSSTAREEGYKRVRDVFFPKKVKARRGK